MTNVGPPARARDDWRHAGGSLLTIGLSLVAAFLVACALAADTTDPASMFDIHASNKHVVALHRCLGGHDDLDIEVAPSTWKDSCDSRN